MKKGNPAMDQKDDGQLPRAGEVPPVLHRQVSTMEGGEDVDALQQTIAASGAEEVQPVINSDEQPIAQQPEDSAGARATMFERFMNLFRQQNDVPPAEAPAAPISTENDHDVEELQQPIVTNGTEVIQLEDHEVLPIAGGTPPVACCIIS